MAENKRLAAELQAAAARLGADAQQRAMQQAASQAPAAGATA
jgi:hypothetical protein